MMDLGKFRKVEVVAATGTLEYSGIPVGYRELRGRIYFSKDHKRLVITGDPVEDADPNGVIHNCDANGCRWEHVIAQLDLTEQQAKEFDICEQE